MKKLIAFLILAVPCFASGPKYNFEDPHLNDEMVNIYKDIKLSRGANPQFTDITLGQNPTAGSINKTFVGLGRNRILNGEMLFDQKNETDDAHTTSAYSSAGGVAHYGLDQWRFEDTNPTSVYDVIRTSETLPIGISNYLFHNAMKIRVITPSPVLAGDGVNMEYPMEGYYMRDFRWGTADAQPVTLSFWVLTSSGGTYSITLLQDNYSTRSYVTTYSVDANGWKHVIITVPGDTQTPQSNWPMTGFGLKVVWDLGSGPVVETSSINTWLNSTVWKAAGTNSLTAGANVMYLTGVQLEIGSQATAFEYVPYDIQLRQLQRYFFKTIPQGFPCTGQQGLGGALSYVAHSTGTSAGGDGVYLHFPSEMTGQFPATITTFNPVVPGGVTWYNLTQSLVSGTPTNPITGGTGGLILNPQVATDKQGDVLALHICVDERLGGP